MTAWLKTNRNFVVTLLTGILLSLILISLPTGYEDAVIYRGAERAVCAVKATDNSNIISSGVIQSGEQSRELYVQNGRFEGQTIRGLIF